MRLLVDACAGRRLTDRLRQAGQDVDFAREWDHIAEDAEILRTAHAQKRIVITRDKDFGTLAVRDHQPHCGIIRLVQLPPSRELNLCLFVLTHHAEDLAKGALITVELHRIRVRLPSA